MRVDNIDEAHMYAVRVAVAMDVISQLDLRQIVARNGIYIYFNSALVVGEWGEKSISPDMEATIQEGVDLRDIRNDAGPCTVCAVGASLLSYARLFDSIPVRPRSSTYDPSSTVLSVYKDGTVDDARPILIKLLGEQFTLDIERVFEGYDINSVSGADYNEHKYGEVGSEKRMRAIMRDVIDQGGDFMLPDYETEANDDDAQY